MLYCWIWWKWSCTTWYSYIQYRIHEWCTKITFIKILEHVSGKILTELFLPMFECRIEIILFQHFCEVYFLYDGGTTTRTTTKSMNQIRPRHRHECMHAWMIANCKHSHSIIIFTQILIFFSFFLLLNFLCASNYIIIMLQKL